MITNQYLNRQKKKQLRQFGLMVGGVLVLIGLWKLYQGKHETARLILWSVGGLLIITSTIVPTLLTPIYWLWMKLAHLLGWVNTRLLLGIIFFVIITPMAVVMKVFGRDALNRKIDKNVDSYWIPRPPIASIKEHCERQF